MTAARKKGVAGFAAATFGAFIFFMVLLMASESRVLLPVGSVAPDFPVPAHSNFARLSDYRGRKNVVLAFYPRDFTPGCTKQLCSYRDSIVQIRQLDAVVLGVSYDNTGFHERFSAAYSLPFALISDNDKAISRAYGAAWFGGLLPFTKRVTFVIDKSGIIRRVVHREFAIEEHIREVVEALRELEPAGTAGATSPESL